MKRLIAAAILALSLAGNAFGLPMSRISGPSPFASLATCAPDSKKSVPQRGAEVETTAAADSEGRIYAAWQQDRYSGKGGAASGIGFARSLDGGQTWENPMAVAGLGCFAGQDFARASDPWLAVGPDGIVYLAALNVMHGLDPDDVMAVSVSRDYGKSFQTSIIPNRSGAFVDKESIAADPDRPGHALVVWVNFGKDATTLRGVETQDGGQTWRGPFTVVDDLDDGQYHSPSVVYYAGRPAVVYGANRFDPSSSNWYVGFEEVHRTTDGSWSDPRKIARASTEQIPDFRAFDVIGAAASQGSRAAFLFIRSKEGERGSRIYLSSINTEAQKPAWRTRRLRRARTIHFFAPVLAYAKDGSLRAALYGKSGQYVAEYVLLPSLNRPRIRQVGKRFPIVGLPTSQYGPMIGDYQGLVCPDLCQAIFAAGGSWAKDGKSDVWAATVR